MTKKTGTPVAALPGAWRYRVSPGLAGVTGSVQAWLALQGQSRPGWRYRVSPGLAGVTGSVQAWLALQDQSRPGWCYSVSPGLAGVTASVQAWLVLQGQSRPGRPGVSTTVTGSNTKFDLQLVSVWQHQQLPKEVRSLRYTSMLLGRQPTNQPTTQPTATNTAQVSRAERFSRKLPGSLAFPSSMQLGRGMVCCHNPSPTPRRH